MQKSPSCRKGHHKLFDSKTLRSKERGQTVKTKEFEEGAENTGCYGRKTKENKYIPLCVQATALQHNGGKKRKKRQEEG